MKEKRSKERRVGSYTKKRRGITSPRTAGACTYLASEVFFKGKVCLCVTHDSQLISCSERYRHIIDESKVCESSENVEQASISTIARKRGVFFLSDVFFQMQREMVAPCKRSVTEFTRERPLSSVSPEVPSQFVRPRELPITARPGARVRLLARVFPKVRFEVRALRVALAASRVVTAVDRWGAAGGSSGDTVPSPCGAGRSVALLGRHCRWLGRRRRAQLDLCGEDLVLRLVLDLREVAADWTARRRRRIAHLRWLHVDGLGGGAADGRHADRVGRLGSGAGAVGDADWVVTDELHHAISLHRVLGPNSWKRNHCLARHLVTVQRPK